MRSDSTMVRAQDRWIQDRQAGQVGPDAWPSHVAGCEQYLSGPRPDADVLDEDGNVVVVGLESTGYATWIADPGTGAVTGRRAALARCLHGNRILVPQSLTERSTLEAQADAILADSYGDPMRIDALRERTRANGVDSTWDDIVKADRVAYRGKVRHRVPAVAYPRAFAFIVAGNGVCVDRRGVTFVLGRSVPAVDADGHPIVDKAGRVKRTVIVAGYVMRGHERVSRASVTVPAVAKKQTHARRARVGKPAGRPAAEPMTASVRTLQRAWLKADAGTVQTAEDIADQLRRIRPGTADVQVTDRVVVTVHAATVTVQGDKPRTMPITELARRVALTH